MTATEQETIIKGIAVSPGIAIAAVHVEARGFSAPQVYEILENKIAEEQARFIAAVNEAKSELSTLQNRLADMSSEEEARIFEAHIMVLEDKALLKRVNEAISSRLQNAEYAFYAVMQNFLEAMRRIPDPYLRERTADIEDVCERVLHSFDTSTSRRMRPEDRHILVAYDLSPSDTASIDRNIVLGFATEMGSINSHTAILARSLGIPAIVGLEKESVIEITALTPAILDGYEGKLILHPSNETLESYRALERKKMETRRSLDALRGEESATRDGRHIVLSANIGLAEELPCVQQSGAAGIGLYRTEFLLLNEEQDEMPNEEAQATTYAKFARAVAPHPVIIRTLDAGGDKLPVEALTEPEPNPFLGWRGIRVSLDREEMFLTQLRAALRASAEGKVALMFPLVSGLSEVIQAKELLKRAKDDLYQKNIPFDENIQTGVMIEVPSAAIIADILAKEVDFFSIGTNDLIQYTVAVDRVNPHVAKLYRPTHPAVIRLIHRTVQAASNEGIWTGICGEMAGDIKLTPLLIGLGIEELSVGPQQVAVVRKAIRSLSHAECSVMADDTLKMSLSADIFTATSTLAKKYYPELLD